MTPHISVVAAVRERVSLLRRMIESLEETATDPQNVELVVRCDNDDPDMIRFLCGLGRQDRFIVGPRLSGYAALPAFANEAARLSRADLVLVVNDDAEFMTQGWDSKLVAHAEKYPDGIFVFGVETANAKNFVFPCVSRKQIDLFGGVFEESLVYPDIWLRDVLSPFGRAIRIPDVSISHNWQGMSADQRRAAHVAHSPEHQHRYARCVEEGRAKVAAALAVPA